MQTDPSTLAPYAREVNELVIVNVNETITVNTLAIVPSIRHDNLSQELCLSSSDLNSMGYHPTLSHIVPSSSFLQFQLQPVRLHFRSDTTLQHLHQTFLGCWRLFTNL